MRIKFNTDGTANLLYTEDICVEEVGKVQAVKRASYVEPTADGKWIADMTPSGGGILGPFAKRSDALSAEVSWINKYILSTRKDVGIIEN